MDVGSGKPLLGIKNPTQHSVHEVECDAFTQGRGREYILMVSKAEARSAVERQGDERRRVAWTG